MVTLPGIFQAARNFLFGTNVTRNLLNTFILNLGTTEVYIDIDAIKAIAEGFNRNTAVYSIVMKFASKFGCIPRYVYNAGAKEEKAYKTPEVLDENHPLVKLLNRPNPYESQDAFFTKICAYWKITGEGMIWLNRGDLNGYRNEDGSFQDDLINKLPVLEMYVLPSNLVNPIPDPYDIWDVLGWKMELGGEPIFIRKGDLVHWKMTSLQFDVATRRHLRGFAPLAAGYKTLAQNNSMSDAAVRMAQNDGARGAMVNRTIGVSQGPVQQANVKRVFDTKINSTTVKSEIAALEGDWHYENFGQTATDMQLLEGKQMSWQELCFLLTTPYELFDSKVTYANKLEAQKGWVSNDVMPACKQLDGELNRVLLKSFSLEGAAFIGADSSELSEMQKDMAAITTALAAAWWMTPNEKREVMEQEPINDAKLDELWIPSGITPLSESGQDPAMQQALQDIQSMQNANTGAN